MANKELKGKQFKIPFKIKEKLKGILNSFDGSDTTKGLKRLKGLIENPTVSYEQLKRMKNYFDNANPNDDINEYRLNGGDTMKYWIDEVLSTERNDIDREKRLRMDTGELNQFKKAHTKSKPIGRDHMINKFKL